MKLPPSPARIGLGQPRPSGGAAPDSAGEAAAAGSVGAPAAEPANDSGKFEAKGSGWAAERPGLAGGPPLPAALLDGHLARAQTGLEALAAAPLPTDLGTLTDRYAELGRVSSTIQAALLSALDAIDGDPAHEAAAGPFRQTEARAMGLLREVGALYAHLEPTFGKLVHGGGGWPARPVELSPDRGDGRPLFAYENTYKKGTVLDESEKQAEFDKRLSKFEANGGRFEDLFELGPDVWDQLPHRQRFDYVMRADGNTRLGTVEGDGKPGHTLLATGGPTRDETPVLLAGEMWALRDAAGHLEALVVANNSGHFKPSYEDLANALPVLEKLGIDPSRVVLFGGPNNLPAMFSEIAEKLGVDSLDDKLPPSPAEVAQGWRAGFVSKTSLQVGALGTQS